ncbi:MAG: DUF2268 domain-containing putative Zn-dependent protease [Bacillota bacterium]
MQVVPLYRSLLAGGWQEVARRYPEYPAALEETYGPEPFAPWGVWDPHHPAIPAARARIRRCAGAGWEDRAAALLRAAHRHLPGPAPVCYLGTLLGLGPAATLSRGGEPVIAVGLERFDPAARPEPPPRSLYHPGELEGMLPHEAAHVARFRALGLPPTPRHLSLAEMLLLEGTALLFTDWLLGRETLPSFLPVRDLARVAGTWPLLLRAIEPELGERGMSIFTRYFGTGAPVSGYALGLALARRYQAATGANPVAVLLTPTEQILAVALP